MLTSIAQVIHKYHTAVMRNESEKKYTNHESEKPAARRMKDIEFELLRVMEEVREEFL